MKFLVDAQLPRTLAQGLSQAGHDAVHTSDLASGNSTSDSEISRISMEERRVVITKDADFADSFVRCRKPWKLVVVSTGNLSNIHLRRIFRENLDGLVSLLEEHSHVEIGQDHILVHD